MSQRSSGFEMPGAYPQEGSSQLTKRRDTQHPRTTPDQRLDQHDRFLRPATPPEGDLGQQQQQQTEPRGSTPGQRFLVGSVVGSASALLANAIRPESNINAIDALAISIASGALLAVAPVAFSSHDKPREGTPEGSQEGTQEERQP
jgi:hypothetical protein